MAANHRTILSVNINKIALLRNSRPGNSPDLIAHTNACLQAGAQGITVHPRPDQRHIRAQDCHALKDFLSQYYPAIEFNIEGNPFATATPSAHNWVSDYPGFMPLVKAIKPHQCTLVPDAESQLTSDHGFDLQQSGEKLQPIIAELKSMGIRVSLFMDPVKTQIKQAKVIGADRIELYTGPYAEAVANDPYAIETALQPYAEAAAFAAEIGLGVNAGHDLNLNNLTAFATIEPLQEVSIGHALTIDALRMGLDKTIQAYLDCLKNSN